MLTFQEFVKRTQSKTIHHSIGVIAFIGPEKFLRDKGIKLIRSDNPDLSKEIKVFQPAAFDGKLFLSELYSVAFFQQRKLVVLDIGQINPQNQSVVNQPAIEASLDEYLQAPSLFSLLIITIAKWILRPEIKELIIKNGGLLVDCANIPDKDLVRWVCMETIFCGKTISLPAAQFLVDKIGNNLAKIDETIRKLILYAGEHKQIGPESLEYLVNEDRTYDKKTLVKALLAHQPHKALKILDRLISEGDEFNQIIGYLTGVFKREPLSLERRREKFKVLLETDLAIKTGLMPEDKALQFLVIKLAGGK